MKSLKLFLALIATLICTSGCTNEYAELSRVSNTDNSIDVVLANRETGATVATPTEIFVVPKGSERLEGAVFRADKVAGATLTWESETQVTIHADAARVFLYSSTVEVRGAKGELKTVRIQLDIKKRS